MLSGDDAPLKKYFLINGLTAISFWISLQWALKGPGLVVGTILKFVCELSVILWLNTAFYLKNNAEGVETESYEFQREQVKLSLFVVGILILAEIPLTISAF